MTIQRIAQLVKGSLQDYDDLWTVETRGSNHLILKIDGQVFSLVVEQLK